ncbi:hypothetical protein HN924_03200 [Candidatus Woesearchaeota archaeon]|jgi:hypothetical protein|nr:hypothetical protein [Candidatus Woesearchaeota archaeon]MBT7062948.1 hypothetical protein [Candidatus Woesearchaeota archaeon]MBT7402570.1 hypothetical protein [Candidatus Woesearchaeota archaeon]
MRLEDIKDENMKGNRSIGWSILNELPEASIQAITAENLHAKADSDFNINQGKGNYINLWSLDIDTKQGIDDVWVQKFNLIANGWTINRIKSEEENKITFNKDLSKNKRYSITIHYKPQDNQ